MYCARSHFSWSSWFKNVLLDSGRCIFLPIDSFARWNLSRKLEYEIVVVPCSIFLVSSWCCPGLIRGYLEVPGRLCILCALVFLGSGEALHTVRIGILRFPGGSVYCALVF